MKYLNHSIAAILLLFFTLPAYCQVDRGGTPRSFTIQNKQSIPVTEIHAPDMALLLEEDSKDVSLEKPYRVGIEIPVSISSDREGQWINIPGGEIWRVLIKCSGAQALGLNFDNFYLSQDVDIFVYTPDKQNIIGSISANELNGTRKYSTRPLAGDELIVEYFRPSGSANNRSITICGLVYQYRGFTTNTHINKNAAGSCEVNINCSEGANWQNEKKSIVKIYCKIGTKYVYCTGTLLNNTAQDFSGLLLTASHCTRSFGGDATKEDLDQWVFYFNYESQGCITSGSENYTMVGAEKLAISDDQVDIGSDFLLLRLRSSIPPGYYPYYCGWDAGPGGSSSGVGIHHPNGEVKKISTYTTPLVSSTWGTTPNTHWVVKWSATENGHGVTEGGSSGSALFDDEKLVVGTLTGGESSCQSLTGEDKYGKFSYSWLSNGATPDQQLKPWLDPLNTGITKMPGTFNQKLAVADFTANSREIPVGGTVNFTDLSKGKPDKWHWYFQNAEPKESFEQNPSGIRFGKYGLMNVKLIVSNANNSDTIVKKEYINVKAVVSPNPTPDGIVKILTDINSQSDILIEVYDLTGKLIQQFNYPAQQMAYYSIRLPERGSLFIIKVIQGDQQQTHKVLVIR